MVNNFAGEQIYDDYDLALDYLAEIIEHCGSDSHCLRSCTKWSSLFLANAIAILTLALLSMCLSMGAFLPEMRSQGTLFAKYALIFNFVLAMINIIHRFRPDGQLCSIYLGRTDIPTDQMSDMSDRHTYKSDGQLFVLLFISQLIATCCCCSFNLLILRKRKSDRDQDIDEIREAVKQEDDII